MSRVLLLWLVRSVEQMSCDSDEFEDFFENCGFAIRVLASDGTILRANAAELELVGYAADEYVGRPFANFCTDRTVADDFLSRLSRGEKLDNFRATLLRKDGSHRHVEITASGRFRDGALVSSWCLTREAPQARLAEERRSFGERHWRAAFDAVPAAIYITDAEGRITYFNNAAVELAGRTPELGTDSWCVTWRLFNIDGTPLPHDECPMAIALKENRPVRGSEAIAERPDGSRVRFLPYPTPLYDEEGRLCGAVNLLVDVTQQRIDEADAARLAAIVVSSNDAIVSKTLDGIVTSWNAGAARTFGYSPSEMVGQPITRIIPTEQHDEERHILAKVRAGERIEHYETVRVTKDGRRIDVSLSVSPVKDKSGRLIGAAKVARDITERKRAEATQRLLMGELNHRVKNTLATVQAIASQTLRLTNSPVEFVPTFSGRIQALAGAHSLLTETNWQGAELRTLVHNQVFAGIESDGRITCSGPEIVLPPQLTLHLALVLHELGTNARKHGALCGPRGQVWIQWSLRPVPDPVLHLRWSEIGGPPVHVDRSPRQGFGTVLIERSMKALEGEAQMRIEAQGISWDISLALPRLTPSPMAGVTTVDRGREPAQIADRLAKGKPQRILVVEDEPLVGLDMVGILSDGGFDVVGPVSTLNEAVHRVATSHFDAVLLDANLGGRSVDELAAALTRQNIPFAFVTGYGRGSLPRAFASAPMVPKPFSAAALLSVTKWMLSAADGAVRMRREE
jgi:PAS domain S-box-containing protein